MRRTAQPLLVLAWVDDASLHRGSCGQITYDKPNDGEVRDADEGVLGSIRDRPRRAMIRVGSDASANASGSGASRRRGASSMAGDQGKAR